MNNIPEDRCSCGARPKDKCSKESVLGGGKMNQKTDEKIKFTLEIWGNDVEGLEE